MDSPLSSSPSATPPSSPRIRPVLPSLLVSSARVLDAYIAFRDDRPESPTPPPSPSGPVVLCDFDEGPSELEAARALVPPRLAPLVAHLHRLAPASVLTGCTRTNVVRAIAHYALQQRAAPIPSLGPVLLVLSKPADVKAAYAELRAVFEAAACDQGLDGAATLVTTAKKSREAAQSNLTSLPAPGVFVAARRTLSVVKDGRSGMSALGSALRKNVHGLSWTLIVSDAGTKLTLDDEHSPFRVVKDGLADHGLFLQCKGDAARDAALEERDVVKYVKRHAGKLSVMDDSAGCLWVGVKDLKERFQREKMEAEKPVEEPEVLEPSPPPQQERSVERKEVRQGKLAEKHPARRGRARREEFEEDVNDKQPRRTSRPEKRGEPKLPVEQPVRASQREKGREPELHAPPTSGGRIRQPQQASVSRSEEREKRREARKARRSREKNHPQEGVRVRQDGESETQSKRPEGTTVRDRTCAARRRVSHRLLNEVVHEPYFSCNSGDDDDWKMRAAEEASEWKQCPKTAQLRASMLDSSSSSLEKAASRSVACDEGSDDRNRDMKKSLSGSRRRRVASEQAILVPKKKKRRSGSGTLHRSTDGKPGSSSMIPQFGPNNLPKYAGSSPAVAASNPRRASFGDLDVPKYRSKNMEVNLRYEKRQSSSGRKSKGREGSGTLHRSTGEKQASSSKIPQFGPHNLPKYADSSPAVAATKPRRRSIGDVPRYRSKSMEARLHYERGQSSSGKKSTRREGSNGESDTRDSAAGMKRSAKREKKKLAMKAAAALAERSGRQESAKKGSASGPRRSGRGKSRDQKTQQLPEDDVVDLVTSDEEEQWQRRGLGSSGKQKSIPRAPVYFANDGRAVKGPQEAIDLSSDFEVCTKDQNEGGPQPAQTSRTPGKRRSGSEGLSRKDRKKYDKLVSDARAAEGKSDFDSAIALYMKARRLHDKDKSIESRYLALASRAGVLRGSDFAESTRRSPPGIVKQKRRRSGQRSRLRQNGNAPRRGSASGQQHQVVYVASDSENRDYRMEAGVIVIDD